MSFIPTIPNLSDFILTSAGQLAGNYFAMFQAFQQDHLNFNDANQGKHNKLTLTLQQADPVTAPSTQIALYNKVGTGSVPQLFFRPSNSGTPIQLSYQTVGNTGTTQYSFLAGPFIFYCGDVLGFTDGQVITLTPTTQLISVILTIWADNIPAIGISVPPAAATAVISGSTFTIQSFFQTLVASPINVSYLAIGLVTA